MFLFVFAVVMYTRSFVRGLLFGVDRGKVKACGEESFRVVQFLGSQDFHGIFTRKTIKKNIYKVVWSHNSASFSSLSTLSAHTLRRRFNTLSVKREFREGEKEERFVYLLRTIRLITTYKNSVVGKECNPPPLPPRLG